MFLVVVEAYVIHFKTCYENRKLQDIPWIFHISTAITAGGKHGFPVAGL